MTNLTVHLWGAPALEAGLYHLDWEGLGTSAEGILQHVRFSITDVHDLCFPEKDQSLGWSIFIGDSISCYVEDLEYIWCPRHYLGMLGNLSANLYSCNHYGTSLGNFREEMGRAFEPLLWQPMQTGEACGAPACSRSAQRTSSFCDSNAKRTDSSFWQKTAETNQWKTQCRKEKH